MSKHGLDPSDPRVRWLAEEAVVADLYRATVDGIGNEETRPVVAPPVSIRELLDYVWRDHDAPDAQANSAIEEAIRSDLTVARRYRNLLTGMAQAFSLVAIAASTQTVPDRTIGIWRLKVSAPGGLVPVLVLEQQAPGPAPSAIEAVGSGPNGGPIRLTLPEPVNQAIQLPLNEDVPELAAFHRLIADPQTQIYLLGSIG